MEYKTPVYTVSQINRHVRGILEKEIGPVFIEGEISNLSQPASGHYYFTLKDKDAQIRCAYFKNRHAAGLKKLETGQQLIAGGVLSLYEARGEYQLIVDSLKEAGLGDLYQKFEQLTTKLQAQGLFSSEQKKAIPFISDTIGLITSPTGAAIQDILITLKRRFPLSKVKIYPTEVQGKNAHEQMIKALNSANREKTCQVLILARGGGSIEDLWAFNQEQLAYAIADSALPVVVGVGHETDFTIADFVADLRAATPTAAAEAVTPNQKDLLAFTANIKITLNTVFNRYIQHQNLLLKHLIGRLISPDRYIQNQWQRLDYLRLNMNQAMLNRCNREKQRIMLLQTKLKACNPSHQLLLSINNLDNLKQTLNQSMLYRLDAFKKKVVTLRSTLDTVSPEATLDRGYAIVTHQHKILFDSNDVSINDEIQIKLARGNLVSSIRKKI